MLQKHTKLIEKGKGTFHSLVYLDADLLVTAKSGAPGSVPR